MVDVAPVAPNEQVVFDRPSRVLTKRMDQLFPPDNEVQCIAPLKDVPLTPEQQMANRVFGELVNVFFIAADEIEKKAAEGLHGYEPAAGELIPIVEAISHFLSGNLRFMELSRDELSARLNDTIRRWSADVPAMDGSKQRRFVEVQIRPQWVDANIRHPGDITPPEVAFTNFRDARMSFTIHDPRLANGELQIRIDPERGQQLSYDIDTPAMRSGDVDLTSVLQQKVIDGQPSHHFISKEVKVKSRSEFSGMLNALVQNMEARVNATPVKVR